MNELQQEFISFTVRSLDNLTIALADRNAENFDVGFFNEIFRLLHTVKGTAQTFGLSEAANLAHALENLLAEAGGRKISPASYSLLQTGVKYLRILLETGDAAPDEAFATNIAAYRTEPPAQTAAELPNDFPKEYAARLSAAEKTRLNAALDGEKFVYVLEIDLAAQQFAAEFLSVRQSLDAFGEIIAALPQGKFAAAGRVGFHIVFAGDDDERVRQISRLAVVYRHEPARRSKAEQMLNKIAAHGAEEAAAAGKTVEFVISADCAPFAAELRKPLFEMALHLVRNAVSHAVERTGVVEISLTNDETRLFLTIADDGRGLDSGLIKARAIERAVIAAEDDLTEPEIYKLIFAPGFSTAERITELAGRGYGLDAVREAAAAAGGAVTAANRSGGGAQFTVALPFAPPAAPVKNG